MSGSSGGDKPPDRTSLNHTGGPVQTSVPTTSAWALGGAEGTEVKMRSFAQIIAEDKQNRNILEIHLVKNATNDSNETVRVKALTYDDLAELIFDVLNVDQSQCIGFNYSTGRYNIREIKFKPGVDLSPYIKSSFNYKGHDVSTCKQMKNATKVSFRNVPFGVPDEEIIQLCKCYGNPVNNRVNYERLSNSRNRGMMGSTRWVEMEFKEGRSMNNFYWLEGPLPGDVGSRITVLHSGQEQQCSNCLKTGSGGCRAMGNGKACVQLDTPRAKMTDYMEELKRTVGYESLKSQYLRQFPCLNKERVGHMDEQVDGYDDEEAELLPHNPIELRDTKILELEKEVADKNALQENMLKMKAELNLAVKNANIANAKVKFARKVTEERLKECLPVPSFEDDHSKVLVLLMSALVDEDSFEIDPDTDSLRPKETFLKDIEDSLELSDDDIGIKNRLQDVKNKLLEKVKAAPVRHRRLSFSSTSSLERKRRSSTELVNEKDAVRNKPSKTVPDNKHE